MNNTNVALPIPRSSSLGLPVYTLSNKKIDAYSLLWGKNGTTKTANVLRAVNGNPGITTDKIRHIAFCSNVPDLVRAINKKLMNVGLMIIRVEPVGVPQNCAFHHWFLVQAPIVTVPVSMAVNDPI